MLEQQDANNNTFAAMLNHLMNVKDSRWLQIEVCREFHRGQCSRTDLECRFAHPPPYVEVNNGRVTACYDSIKGKCQREKCKYLHTPQHLKDQLLTNGKNALAVKNMIMSQVSPGTPTPTQVPIPAPIPAVPSQLISQPTPAFMASAGFPGYGIPGYPQYALSNGLSPLNNPSAIFGGASPYLNIVTSLPIADQIFMANSNPAMAMSLMSPTDTNNLLTASQQFSQSHKPETLPASTANARKRRFELTGDCAGTSAVENMLANLAAQQQPQINPYKRQAVEKSGLPVYQPSYLPTLPTPATLASFFPYQPIMNMPSPACYGQPLQLPVQMFPNGASVPAAASPDNAALAFAASNPLAAQMMRLPTNIASVAYFDESGQLLETLPVCRDFKHGLCQRPSCRYVHLMEDYVEIINGKVTVCRDFAKGKCTRIKCKYYHVPALPGSLLFNRLMLSSTIASMAANQMRSGSLSPLQVAVSSQSPLQQTIQPNMIGPQVYSVPDKPHTQPGS